MEQVDTKLYWVYCRYEYCKINGFSQYGYKFEFYIDKKKAQKAGKRYRNEKPNVDGNHKIRVTEFNFDKFLSFSYNKQTTITNSVKKDYYRLSGYLKQFHESEGQRIPINFTFDALEEGEKVLEIINKYNSKYKI